MPPKGVQAALRRFFGRWGLPERVRVDNGWPWGSSADLPPGLCLWLVGLGVGVSHNPPRRPQANAKVERFHGLVEPWGEPEGCAGMGPWQARLDWLSGVQRERYPSLAGQSRLAAFPQLSRAERSYPVAAGGWQLERVTAYLAGGLWRRRVDKVGRITLYHRPYGVGRAYRGQEVFVRFDPRKIAWVIADKEGQTLCEHPAREINAQSIVHLEVGLKRRPNPTAVPAP